MKSPDLLVLLPNDIIDPELEPTRRFQLHYNDLSGARCLDGTRHGVYYSKGFGDGSSKAIVHFSSTNKTSIESDE